MAIIHRITTDDTLTDDLLASLRLHGVKAGRTVAEFFGALSALGLRPDDVLGSVEYGIASDGNGRLVIEDNGNGWEVRERTS